MKLLKWLLRVILGLASFFGTIFALSVPFVPMMMYVDFWAGKTMSALAYLPVWAPFAAAGISGFLATVLVKVLPIKRNKARTITDIILFGLIFGGAAYVSYKYFNYYVIISGSLKNMIFKYLPWRFLSPLLASNLNVLLTGAGILLFFLIIATIGRTFRNKAKLEAQIQLSSHKPVMHTTAPSNVVSSTDGNRIADYKAKKYVRDIWGNYIEEDDYNARINESKNHKI